MRCVVLAAAAAAAWLGAAAALSYLLADVELRLTRTITLSLEERLDLAAARDKHADQARKDASVEGTIRDLGEWHDAL